MPSRARVNATSDTQQLAEDLRRASSQIPNVVVTSGRFTAQIGQAVRVRPGAAGVDLNLPPADQASAGGSVTFFIEPAGGIATVRCPNGTVNAQTSLNLSAPGILVFESNGKGGWFCGTLANGAITTAMISANSVTNAKLAQMPAYTVKGNPNAFTSDAEDVPIGQGLSVVNSTLDARNYERRRWGFTDDFLRNFTTLAADGTVDTGQWRWFFNLLVGTPTVSFASGGGLLNHPGNVRFTLPANSTCSFSATATDLASTDAICVFSNFERCDCVLRVITSLSAAFFEFGIASTLQDFRTATLGAWLEYNQGSDTDLHARTRAGAADTANVDLGSSATISLNDYVPLSIRKQANNDLDFYVDDLLETTVPAATHGLTGSDAVVFGFYFDTGATALAFDLDQAAFFGTTNSRT